LLAGDIDNCPIMPYIELFPSLNTKNTIKEVVKFQTSS
jgi:hypothetical protein